MPDRNRGRGFTAVVQQGGGEQIGVGAAAAL